MKTKHPSFPTEFECFAFQKYMHQMPKKIFNGGMAKLFKKSFNTSICWIPSSSLLLGPQESEYDIDKTNRY